MGRPVPGGQYQTEEERIEALRQACILYSAIMADEGEDE